MSVRQLAQTMRAFFDQTMELLAALRVHMFIQMTLVEIKIEAVTASKIEKLFHHRSFGWFKYQLGVYIILIKKNLPQVSSFAGSVTFLQLFLSSPVCSINQNILVLQKLCFPIHHVWFEQAGMINQDTIKTIYVNVPGHQEAKEIPGTFFQ